MRTLIHLVEGAARPHPTMLYHGTSAARARMIIKQGMDVPSYWASQSVARYYAEVAEDEGEQTAIISLQIERFDPSLLEPDPASLEEPITTALSKEFRGMSRSRIPWQSCFGKVESIIYTGSLTVTEDDVQFLPFEKKVMNSLQRQNFERLARLDKRNELSDNERDTYEFMQRNLKVDPWG